ncbi:phosphohistidine phosphatase SixA [Bowmanella sp. JS7-9]|uniref:Phosphohistidine phosphatase SixA n=1 Tax=Pseudobowmanella zhangzhouensis TaxID=1537679 RepID=A0ABW1XMI1_9ALTE|nr:phosphohistidine phosphatase SixA [Bowmanella sp. JS7-9]TBX22523.1 hypothetical protein TK45_08745 [Bowmanella sp. JS7-9]
MKLYVMRHGDAQLQASKDSLRPLTQTGIDEVRQAAAWLKQTALTIDVVLVSPYLRAQQTWQTLSDDIHAGQLFNESNITPDSPPAIAHESIDALLNALPDAATALIVSHMPLVCYLIQEMSGNCAPLMATASVIELDYDPQRGCGTQLRTFQPK